MRKNKFWRILIVLIVAFFATISYTSCGSDGEFGSGDGDYSLF